MDWMKQFFVNRRLKQVLIQRSLLIFVLVASVSGMSLPAWAAGYILDSISVNPANNTIQIKSQGTVRGIVNSVNVGMKKRIIWDIENAEISSSMPRDSELLQNISRQLPMVKNISVNQFGGAKPVVRILLDVDNKEHPVQLLNSIGNSLELRIGGQSARLPVATQSTVRPVQNNTAPNGISERALRESLLNLNQRYEQLTRGNNALKSEIQQLSTSSSQDK